MNHKMKMGGVIFSALESFNFTTLTALIMFNAFNKKKSIKTNLDIFIHCRS